MSEDFRKNVMNIKNIRRDKMEKDKLKLLALRESKSIRDSSKSSRNSSCLDIEP